MDKTFVSTNTTNNTATKPESILVPADALYAEALHMVAELSKLTEYITPRLLLAAIFAPDEDEAPEEAKEYEKNRCVLRTSLRLLRKETVRMMEDVVVRMYDLCRTEDADLSTAIPEIFASLRHGHDVYAKEGIRAQRAIRALKDSDQRLTSRTEEKIKALKEAEKDAEGPSTEGNERPAGPRPTAEHPLLPSELLASGAELYLWLYDLTLMQEELLTKTSDAATEFQLADIDDQVRALMGEALSEIIAFYRLMPSLDRTKDQKDHPFAAFVKAKGKDASVLCRALHKIEAELDPEEEPA